MSGQKIHGSLSAVELLEKIMHKEKEAAELYQHNASVVEDPDLKSVFLRIANSRINNYKELELKLIKIKSELEITNQINEMFY
jgi:rubrerythrin